MHLAFITLDFKNLLYTLSWTVALDRSSRGVVSEMAVGAAAAAGVASTNGTFSLSGEEEMVTVIAVVAVGGSSAVKGSLAASAGGGPPKPWAISSNVLPFVSGTLMKVKMKKKIRKAVKMRKTQGPHTSCENREEEKE